MEAVSESVNLSLEIQWLLDVLSDVSIVIASGALILALVNFRNSVQHSRAQLFLHLRARYDDVRAEMDAAFGEGDGQGDGDGAAARETTPYAKLNRDQRNAVRNYWTNAFNEWCATARIYSHGSGTLWRKFYANAQASALLSRPLREGLLDLMRSTYSFGGMKSDYRNVVLEMARRLTRGAEGRRREPSERAEIESFVRELADIKIR